MNSLDYIRVVLVEPTHPGNIGATARAMANFGFDRLVLVNPKRFPDDIANARAAGADWILENAVVVNSLDQAIADCTYVLGTTAREREIEWPVLSPLNAMSEVRNRTAQQIALLFGRESSGLKNSELDTCNALIRIPVNPEFASLNLGSAVTVLLYELRRQLIDHSDSIDSSAKHEPMASHQEIAGFHQHLNQVLAEIEFTDGRSSKLGRKLARLFSRTELYSQEVRMLRGILKAIQRKTD